MTVEWPNGNATLNWPAKIPVDDGADYLMRIKGRLIAHRLTLRVVPSTLMTDPHRAVWMLANGCEYQAQCLLSLIR